MCDDTTILSYIIIQWIIVYHRKCVASSSCVASSYLWVQVDLLSCLSNSARMPDVDGRLVVASDLQAALATNVVPASGVLDDDDGPIHQRSLLSTQASSRLPLWLCDQRSVHQGCLKSVPKHFDLSYYCCSIWSLQNSSTLDKYRYCGLAENEIVKWAWLN